MSHTISGDIIKAQKREDAVLSALFAALEPVAYAIMKKARGE